MAAVPETLYPWQASQWSMLLESAAASRLHHAILISGQRGVGKLDFAAIFARFLLCQNFPKARQPCGRCERCSLMAAGTHPDFTLVDWLDKASVIGVEQIRKLTDKLSLTATYGSYQIVVINRADSMTSAAYNSLLKTLEEPPGSCVLILLSERDAALPATIHSRCQRIVMRAPSMQQSLDWLRKQGVAMPEVALEFARGGPLLALEFASQRNLTAISSVREHWQSFLLQNHSPAALAAETAKHLSTGESLTLFMQWTADFVKTFELSHAISRSSEGAVRIERRFLSQTMQLLQQALRLDNTSLKTQAVLEGVLADIRIQRIRVRAEKTA